MIKDTQLEIPWLKFKRNKLGMISLIILIILYSGLLFEGFLAPYAPNTKFKTKSFQPPHTVRFISEGKFIGPYVHEYRISNRYLKEYQVDRKQVHRLRLFVKGDPYKLFFLIPADRHLFGTADSAPFFLMGADRLGRDLFSRIIYGARISLTLGFVAVFVSLVGGLVIGGLSGYIGGFTDWIIMRLAETVILLPTFYFFLFLRSIMPSGITPAQKFLFITIILAVPGWAGSARGIRNWVLSLKNTDFVIAAQLAGIPRMKIIFRHIIPQIRNILILGITLSIPGVILGETGLSFLGLGITEPSVSWGMLMNAALDINILNHYPWILYPAFTIIITVFSFFAFGYALKDAFDPRSNE